MPGPEPVFTPELQARFLHELAGHGNVRLACARTGVSRAAAYLARRRDERFAAGWRAALVLARDHVEAVLAERALEGVEDEIYYRGELMATRRKFDNRLLLAHIARLDRLCADRAACQAAARFDDELAVIAGLPEAMGTDPDTHEPEPMDYPPRGAYVIAMRSEVIGDDFASEEEEDRAMAQAARAAAVEWDAFHRPLWTALDRVLAAPGNLPQDCVHSVHNPTRPVPLPDAVHPGRVSAS